MRTSAFRLRKTSILCLASLCWAGAVVFGQPASGDARPNRTPAVGPQTRGSAESRAKPARSRRQNRLPAQADDGSSNAADSGTNSNSDANTNNDRENSDPTKKQPEREELDAAEERRRRESIQAFLDARIKDLMNELRVPGAAIAVVRRDRVYMLQGYGFGDLPGKGRVDAIHTRFPVGRISANLTAAAVLHARDRGLLALNAPADSYLAAPLPRPLGRRITIQDLLLRETGFAAVNETGGFDAPALAPALDEYLRRTRPPYRRRDTGPSDYEINLMGRILERQSRLAFNAHMKQFFFRPIGMNRSSFAYPGPAQNARAQAGTDVADLARPYRYETAKAEGRFTQLPERYFAPAPALGLYTTAGDMARYLVMLLNGGSFGQARLLGEEAAKRMLDVKNEDRFLRPTYHYALEPLQRFETGIPGRPTARRALVSRGDLPGYTAVLCLAPEKEFGVFLAANSHAPEFREEVLRSFLDRFVFQ